MRRIAFLSAASLSLAVTLLGCKHDAPADKSGTSATPSHITTFDPPPDPATMGSLSGTVRFEGKAPAPVRIDMSQDPACAITGGENFAEQYVVGKTGGLANVFVYVKNAPHLKVTSQPAVIDQKGCRFVPHVVAIPAGGSVEFRNSDPTMHNVHSMAVQTGNHSVDISQGPGAKPETLALNDPENMLPVRCNNHPWMNAFINVSPNTFFSVSAADGSFNIKGLPAGSYTLAFVHEKLGEQDVPVTVKAKADTTATATFRQP